MRVSHPDAAELLEPSLQPFLVDDLSAPNWSLRVGGFPDAREHGDSRLHLLFRACSQAARSRRPSDVVRAFADHVHAFSGMEPAGWVADVTVLVDGEGRAVLAPPSWQGPLLRHGRRLHGAGILVSAASRVAIDLSDGTVCVPEPAVRFDEASLEALDSTFGRSAASLHVAAGDYPVAAWAVTLDPERDSPARRVASVAGFMERVPDADRAQVLLESLHDHLASVPAVPVLPDEPGALLGAVLSLFDRT